jgi:predicted helicase
MLHDSLQRLAVLLKERRPEVRLAFLPVNALQVWRGRHELVGYAVTAEGPETAESWRTFSPNLLAIGDGDAGLTLFRRGRPAGRALALETARPLIERFFDPPAPARPTPQSLARAMALRARRLEVAVADLLARGEGSADLSRLFQAMGRLLPGQDAAELPDLFAQTVVYGLLAARLRESHPLGRQTLPDTVPSSGVLREVFRCAGLSAPPEIAWLVDDLIELLRPPLVRHSLERSFHAGRGRDAILHFYEAFLQAYDPAQRGRRGVYYTPLPLVSYVVRSVDHLLRTRLDMPEGLADRRVRLLDPAAGTMAFVLEAFRVAIAGRRARAARADTSGVPGVPALVRDHLLRHFYGLELMMAPYAVGHLRATLFLEEQGLGALADDGVGLLLTDTLDVDDDSAQMDLPELPALSREARRAAEVKGESPFCVVLGNPPWAGRSANRGRWISRLLRQGVSPEDEGYFRVDGYPLGERNSKWLQDDYVKFFRYAQWQIERHGQGIVALVTNHGWLDNPTFRGMRRSLLRTFDEIHVLDLHGNRRKRETGPHGTYDENLFEGIEQGAAVALLVKRPGLASRVVRADLWGTRAYKQRWLGWRDAANTPWEEIRPRAPLYLFASRDPAVEERYARGVPLIEIFPEHSVGVLTGRDAFVLDFDRERLRDRIVMLRSGLLPGELVPVDYPRDTRSWQLAEAARRAAADDRWEERFTEILLRPFDARQIFYADYLVERPREKVMRHLLGEQNVALVVPRQGKDGPGALVTDRIVGHKAVSAYDVNHVFPLWLRAEGVLGRRPNLAPALLRFLERAHGAPPEPEAVLGYVYAVLYSPLYRKRYDALLRTDFPRILFARDRQLFAALARLGGELIALHLLRSPVPSEVRFGGAGSGRLGRSRRLLRDYRPREGRVYINEERQYFEGIDEPVWHYRIGGHQVLDRWLQDRAGRTLSPDEIRHFGRAAAALRGTLELERRIDEVYAAVEEEAEVRVGS